MQVCWCRDKWVIASRSYANINTRRFGSSCTIWESFETALNSYGLSPEDMNRDRLYTFLLQDPAFCGSIKSKGLYLLSIFDRVAKSAVVEDQVKESSLPRISSKKVSVREYVGRDRLVPLLHGLYKKVNAIPGM